MKKSLLGFLTLLMLAGCGASPEPDYYVLAAVPGTAQADVATSVKVVRPSVPDYLDRPEIVRQSGAYRVDIDDRRHWAAPLDEMVERILTEDLRQRLPSSEIVSGRDDTIAASRMTVELSVENFNGTDDGALLKAQISVQDKMACDAQKRESIPYRATVSSSDIGALSNLIGQLADRMTAMIREKSAQPPCGSQTGAHKSE